MVFTDVQLSNADTKNIAYNSFSGVLIVIPFPVFDFFNSGGKNFT